MMMGAASEDPVLQPDSMVDHYRILQLLGRGGMGEVYLARDTKLGRQAALKMIRYAYLPSDRKAVERFLEEARITASLNHPHMTPAWQQQTSEMNPAWPLTYKSGHSC
ncbi:MAG: hypothetical protein V2A73_06960 [Pseudomonadota bacterium]